MTCSPSAIFRGVGRQAREVRRRSFFWGFLLHGLVGALLFCLDGKAGAETSPEKLPPELATLDLQFKALQTERVTAPFVEALARLERSYAGSLDKALVEAKKTGHLDDVLALSAEIKRVAEAQVVPEKNDDKTPSVLSSLRAIYNTARGKAESARQANLKQLTDALDPRLAALEMDLTKADRLADALIVRRYRQAQGGMKEAPDDSRVPLQVAPPARGTSLLEAKTGLTNTLGMKFVPVPGTNVLFCVHKTRYKDYAAFAAEDPKADMGWKDQALDGYAITQNAGEHPVTNVNWTDAQAFCSWLSIKEGRLYRLPTDKEWSYAVGIGFDEKWTKDTTPSTVRRDEINFPWGTAWPPPRNAGNYSDRSRKDKAPGTKKTSRYLENYDDGFPTTSPVMAFSPNRAGLYDMGSNLMEWVEDPWDATGKNHLLRGSSWNHADRATMLSSARHKSTRGWRSNNYGFRVVIVTSP